MATIRVIHTDRVDSARMHMFGNLAEDIWATFRDNPRVEADLEAVDRGSDTLVVKVRTGLKGRILHFTQIPIGRILNRSARPEDRPALFAAQFALSHAAWLLTYPLAGWLGSVFGLPAAALGLAALAAVAMVAVMRLWPATDPVELAHAHPDLPADHPHLQSHQGDEHRHALMIDDLHHRWPSATRSTA